MKAQTIHIADDGSRFESRERCEAYEHVAQQVWGIMAHHMNAKPTKESQYTQQAASAVISAQRALVLLWISVAKPNPIDKHIEHARDTNQLAALGAMGRYLDDGEWHPIRRAWFRLACIDRQWREWTQPYYAHKANEEINSGAAQP